MRLLRQFTCGQSVPQIMRSGAAAMNAWPNGTASSKPLSILELRLPFESIIHQPWFLSMSISQRQAG